MNQGIHHFKCLHCILTVSSDKELTLKNWNIPRLSCSSSVNSKVLHSFHTYGYYSEDSVILRFIEDNSPVRMVDARSHSRFSQSNQDTQSSWLLLAYYVCIYNRIQGTSWCVRFVFCLQWKPKECCRIILSSPVNIQAFKKTISDFFQ